jgi:hypothetical protein
MCQYMYFFVLVKQVNSELRVALSLVASVFVLFYEQSEKKFFVGGWMQKHETIIT